MQNYPIRKNVDWFKKYTKLFGFSFNKQRKSWLSWLNFKNIYLKIIFSILIVVALMFALQGGLNKLKLRNFASEATVSKMQVFASIIEDVIVQNERLGLEISESAGVMELLERQLEQNNEIYQILIVKPNGKVIFSAGMPVIDSEYKESVLRRVFSGSDKISMIDAGRLLYSGRTMQGSANNIIGAVVITVSTKFFMEQSEKVFSNLLHKYLVLFGVISIFLIPFIMIQFSGIHQVHRLFSGHNVVAGNHPALRELQELINDGEQFFDSAEKQLRTSINLNSGDSVRNDDLKKRI